MLSRTWIAALAASATLALAGTAWGGVCPGEHVFPEARELEPAQSIAVGPHLLGEVDLAGWRGIGNFKLLSRHLIIDVNGVPPTHDHSDRPSIVFIHEGEIHEYNAHCAVPILHQKGDVAVEFGQTTIHFRENRAKRPVIVFSSDVVPFKAENAGDM